MFLQSCSGGTIGNFLESSFNDLEKTSQEEVLQKNLLDKKNVVSKNEVINDKNYEKLEKIEKPKYVSENKKNLVKENKDINDKKNKKIKKVENIKNVLEIINDTNPEKFPKKINSKIKNS